MGPVTSKVTVLSSLARKVEAKSRGKQDLLVATD